MLLFFLLSFSLLVPAGSPRIIPSNPVATEGEPHQLRCLSEGGSPDPEIKWMRDGQELQAEMKYGKRRDIPTESILTIDPRKEDHLAIYYCKVWNRAMKESDRLERSITLNVNCKCIQILMVNIKKSHPLFFLIHLLFIVSSLSLKLICILLYYLFD